MSVAFVMSHLLVWTNKCPHIIQIIRSGNISMGPGFWRHAWVHSHRHINWFCENFCGKAQEYLYKVGGLGVLGDNFLNFRLNHSGLLWGHYCCLSGEILTSILVECEDNKHKHKQNCGVHWFEAEIFNLSSLIHTILATQALVLYIFIRAYKTILGALV